MEGFNSKEAGSLCVIGSLTVKTINIDRTQDGYVLAYLLGEPAGTNWGASHLRGASSQVELRNVLEQEGVSPEEIDRTLARLATVESTTVTL